MSPAGVATPEDLAASKEHGAGSHAALQQMLGGKK